MFFFFNDTATTEIYTLSLHDALPIFWVFHPRFLKTFFARACIVALVAWKALSAAAFVQDGWCVRLEPVRPFALRADRKSTRLNSSHLVISYAVFCLKKKKNMNVHVRY